MAATIESNATFTRLDTTTNHAHSSTHTLPNTGKNNLHSARPSPSKSSDVPPVSFNSIVVPSPSSSVVVGSSPPAPLSGRLSIGIPRTVYSRTAPSNLHSDAMLLSNLMQHEMRARERAVELAKEIPLAVSTRSQDIKVQPERNTAVFGVQAGIAPNTPAGFPSSSGGRTWARPDDVDGSALVVDDLDDGLTSPIASTSRRMKLSFGGRRRVSNQMTNGTNRTNTANDTQPVLHTNSGTQLPSTTQQEVERLYSTVVSPSVAPITAPSPVSPIALSNRRFQHQGIPISHIRNGSVTGGKRRTVLSSKHRFTHDSNGHPTAPILNPPGSFDSDDDSDDIDMVDARSSQRGSLPRRVSGTHAQPATNSPRITAATTSQTNTLIPTSPLHHHTNPNPISRPTTLSILTGSNPPSTPHTPLSSNTSTSTLALSHSPSSTLPSPMKPRGVEETSTEFVLVSARAPRMRPFGQGIAAQARAHADAPGDGETTDLHHTLHTGVNANAPPPAMFDEHAYWRQSQRAVEEKVDVNARNGIFAQVDRVYPITPHRQGPKSYSIRNHHAVPSHDSAPSTRMTRPALLQTQQHQLAYLISESQLYRQQLIRARAHKMRYGEEMDDEDAYHQDTLAGAKAVAASPPPSAPAGDTAVSHSILLDRVAPVTPPRARSPAPSRTLTFKITLPPPSSTPSASLATGTLSFRLNFAGRTSADRSSKGEFIPIGATELVTLDLEQLSTSTVSSSSLADDGVVFGTDVDFSTALPLRDDLSILRVAATSADSRIIGRALLETSEMKHDNQVVFGFTLNIPIRTARSVNDSNEVEMLRLDSELHVLCNTASQQVEPTLADPSSLTQADVTPSAVSHSATQSTTTNSLGTPTRPSQQTGVTDSYHRVPHEKGRFQFGARINGLIQPMAKHTPHVTSRLQIQPHRNTSSINQPSGVSTSTPPLPSSTVLPATSRTLDVWTSCHSSLAYSTLLAHLPPPPPLPPTALDRLMASLDSSAPPSPIRLPKLRPIEIEQAERVRRIAYFELKQKQQQQFEM